MATSKAVNIRKEKTEHERRGTRTKDLPNPSSFFPKWKKRNRTQLRLLNITLRAQKLRAAAVLRGKPSHQPLLAADIREVLTSSFSSSMCAWMRTGRPTQSPINPNPKTPSDIPEIENSCDFCEVSREAFKRWLLAGCVCSRCSNPCDDSWRRSSCARIGGTNHAQERGGTHFSSPLLRQT